jgi:hypothetical protein
VCSYITGAGQRTPEYSSTNERAISAAPAKYRPLGGREVVRSFSVSPDGHRLAVEAGHPTAIWIYDTMRGTRSALDF